MITNNDMVLNSKGIRVLKLVVLLSYALEIENEHYCVVGKDFSRYYMGEEPGKEKIKGIRLTKSVIFLEEFFPLSLFRKGIVEK